jgi:hypothetical protein
MTIVTISVADQTNPTEIQSWLDANPTVSICNILQNGSLFYVVYQ